MQGKSFSMEHRLKLSKAFKGKTPHNKGRTKEDYEPLMRASQKMVGHQPHYTRESIQKGIDTKRKNKSFNVSKQEELMYEQLVNEYGYDDVIRQYVDKERYPFPCDFYIKSQDLFIEYNGTIEHNREPFDSNNENHIEQLEVFTQRAIQAGEKSRYWNIIKVWTERDPLKLRTMRENNLNFIVVYPNISITK